jgi:hypothetical protein
MRKYRLPLTNIVLSEKEIWGDQAQQPIMLRPNDMPLYGLPVATVNDMVYRASETQDPLPFIKLGRKTLIPRIAFEKWLLRQAHVREIAEEGT